jgi:hypothetical protein
MLPMHVVRSWSGDKTEGPFASNVLNQAVAFSHTTVIAF